MCKYCEGPWLDRKDLTDNKYTDFYIGEDNKLIFNKVLTMSHINYTIEAEVNINFCPMCGKFIGQNETDGFVNVKSKTDELNNQIKYLRDELGIYLVDDENHEWYLDEIEYSGSLDQFVFTTKVKKD